MNRLMRKWGLRWKYRRKEPVWFPLVLRSWHNEQVAKDHAWHVKVIKYLEQDNAEERKQLGAILRKSINYRYTLMKGQRYRIMVEVDPQVLQLVNGGEQEAVRYLARRMGIEFERELLTLNFMRFAEKEDNWSATP